MWYCPISCVGDTSVPTNVGFPQVDVADHTTVPTYLDNFQLDDLV